MIVIKDNKYLMGEYEQNDINVYEVSLGIFLVEIGERQYIVNYNKEVSRVLGKLMVCEVNKLTYVGTRLILNDKAHFFHNMKDAGIVLCISCDEIDRIFYCDKYEFQGLRVFSRTGIKDMADYLIVEPFIIFKKSGEIIEFKIVPSLALIQRAMATNEIRRLQRLCELARQIRYLGRYNLYKSLVYGDGNIFDRLCKELEKDSVQELLLAGESKAEFNLRRALNMMGQVDTDNRFNGWDIEIELISGDVIIRHPQTHVIYIFGVRGNKRRICTQGEQLVAQFCHNYSLSRDLTDFEVKQWAILLKSLGKDRIKVN